MKILIFLAYFYLPFAEAQVQKQVFTLLVRSGPDLMKLLVEKRADLAIGVISGTVVTLGDHTLAAMFSDRDKPKLNTVIPTLPKVPPSGCSTLSLSTVACKDNFNLPGERQVSRRELDKVISDLDMKPVQLPANKFLNTGKLLTTSDFDSQLDETMAWWKATQTNTIGAYNQYLKDFPQGQHVNQAIVRGVILKPQITATPQPSEPPPATSMPCSPFESAMIEPLKNMREAVNRKDVTGYANQFFDEATYRDRHQQLNKFQLVASREQSFKSWSFVNVNLEDMKVTPGNLGEASVSGTMDLQTELQGDPSHRRSQQRITETYKVACSVSGRWRILEYVADLP